MDAAPLAALGVFLSGSASIISAVAALRVQKKRSGDECEERIEEMKRTTT